MVSRLLGTFAVLILTVMALHLSRPVAIDGLDLSSGAVVEDSSRLAPSSPVGAGDRVIAVGGAEVISRADVFEQIDALQRDVDMRIAKSENLRRLRVEAELLQGDLPEELLPTFFILTIDNAPAYGATTAEVARALQTKDSVFVEAVPTSDVLDGVMPVERGLPATNLLLAAIVSLLSLVILWRLSGTLGWALGLASSGAALWMLSSPPMARFLGLGALCVAAAIAAWMVLQMLPTTRMTSGVGRAKRYEGKNARPDLLAALEQAEEGLGMPLSLVVGSSQQAVVLRRDYERLHVESAGAVLTSSLSLLALEGGVFPRMDVGEGVPQVWDDPIHDMDKSAGVAAAVPVPAYGISQDQWAFLMAHTKDAASSPQHIEPMLATVELWVEQGIREAIAVQAAHGLLRLIREAKNTTGVRPHRPEHEAASTDAFTDHVPGTPVPEVNPNLELVSEGIGIPRVVRREELARERGTWTGSGPQPPQSAKVVAATSRPPGPPTELRSARIERTRGDDKALAVSRAWAGHLSRRWSDEYPVDDTRLFNDTDWKRLARITGDERPCLIFGESGVGKEFSARAVHEFSNRSKFPIAVIDCARMPASSVEMELFGVAGDPGVVTGIEGGSLVLKSPLKLGRTLLETTLRQLGRYDIRLFLVERSAHVDASFPSGIPTVIREKVEARCVRIPPLRERVERIVDYAEVILETESMLYSNGEARDLDDMAERLLESMDFPANFWDLKAILRAGMLRADEDKIDVRSVLGVSAGDVPREIAKIEAEEERQRLVSALHQTEGNKSEAARVLGLSRGAFLRRLRRHGLM